MKYIIYNKSKLNDYEMCDYLKSLMIFAQDLQENQWSGYVFHSGIESEMIKNNNSIKIVIKGETNEN